MAILRGPDYANPPSDPGTQVYNQDTHTSLNGSREMHHAKTGLKRFDVVILEEDLASTSPAKLFFGMTLSVK